MHKAEISNFNTMYDITQLKIGIIFQNYFLKKRKFSQFLFLHFNGFLN